MLKKVLSLIVLVKYGRLPIDVRYYYRDTYLCQLRQLRYFFRDYIFKSRYKELSFDGEFAPELQFALPFAYWHYKNGTLKSTKSSKYTKEMYFFSDNHEEYFSTRTNAGNYNFEMPRVLYSHNYNMEKCAPAFMPGRTSTSHGHDMIGQPVTLSGYAAWPQVADTVIQAIHILCQKEESQGFR